MDEAVIQRAQASQQTAEETWYREWLEGPTRTNWTHLPPQTGDRAPDLELPDTQGRPRHLSEWWSEGPLHLLFLRHFGCSCLTDRWQLLEPAMTRIREAGAAIVAVSQADWERAAVVAARRAYPFPVLADPARAAYEAYGLPEGTVPTILHDFPWRPGDRETAEQWVSSRRGTERALVDHTWQLPGEFIIARGGRIVLAHRAQFCEDFPPAEVLLGAIAAAGA